MSCSAMWHSIVYCDVYVCNVVFVCMYVMYAMYVLYVMYVCMQGGIVG